jgi:hypothetical protein
MPTVAAFLIIRVRRVPIMEAYDRHQDASDAWDPAIKAVKAVLIDVVVPKKTNPNLDHVLGHLQRQGNLFKGCNSKTEGRLQRSSIDQDARADNGPIPTARDLVLCNGNSQHRHTSAIRVVIRGGSRRRKSWSRPPCRRQRGRYRERIEGGVGVLRQAGVDQ